jgi:hypothetical protein
MDRSKMYNLLAEEISKDQNLLAPALAGLSQAVQSLAMQHEGVRGYGKMVRYLKRLDDILQGEMDDVQALVSEDR